MFAHKRDKVGLVMVVWMGAHGVSMVKTQSIGDGESLEKLEVGPSWRMRLEACN